MALLAPTAISVVPLTLPLGIVFVKFKSTEYFVPGSDYGPIAWIEELLQTPIGDFRKRSRDLILVPYLIIRRGMSDIDQITEIVMKFADKCAELYRLEPSRREYEKEVRSRVYEVMRDRIPPMRLETLKEKNPGLYDRLLYVPN